MAAAAAATRCRQNDDASLSHCWQQAFGCRQRRNSRTAGHPEILSILWRWLQATVPLLSTLRRLVAVDQLRDAARGTGASQIILTLQVQAHLGGQFSSGVSSSLRAGLRAHALEFYLRSIDGCGRYVLVFPSSVTFQSLTDLIRMFVSKGHLCLLHQDSWCQRILCWPLRFVR